MSATNIQTIQLTSLHTTQYTFHISFKNSSSQSCNSALSLSSLPASWLPPARPQPSRLAPLLAQTLDSTPAQQISRAFKSAATLPMVLNSNGLALARQTLIVDILDRSHTVLTTKTIMIYN